MSRTEARQSLDAAALASLVELAHDAVLVRTPDSAIVFWNRGAEHLYGWSREEALGRSSHELLATAFPHPLTEIELELAAGGRWEGELRHRTKSGAEVVVESTWARQLDAAGKPVAVLEVNRDITDRLAAENELAAEAARLRAVFDASLDAILLTAPDGRILAANAAAEAMFGRAEEEIVAGGRGLLVDRTDPRLAAGLREREETGRVRGDLRLLRSDGSAFEAEVSSVVFLDAAGEPRTSMIVRDVTERARALEASRESEARLRELDTLKSEFVALVSHELRTPLTSITTHLAVLEAGEAGVLNERQLRYLEAADRNARRLRRLVDDLLFVARADSGTFTLECGPVQPAALAEEVVDALRPAAAAAGVDLRLTVAAAPVVEADRDRIVQLLDNLVGNALKFTPAEGSVDVRVDATDAEAILAVSDTGVGISAEDQPQLFERFYRGRSAAQSAGAGLGLAIVREIVDAHRGTIRVESAPGRGTTFTVALPLAG